MAALGRGYCWRWCSLTFPGGGVVVLFWWISICKSGNAGDGADSALVVMAVPRFGVRN